MGEQEGCPVGQRQFLRVARVVPDYAGEPPKAKLGPEHVALFFHMHWFPQSLSHFYSSPYWYSKVVYFLPNQFAATFSIQTWPLSGGQ